MNVVLCADELEKALCSRVVAAKGEVVEKGHTVEQAKYGRDALAKVLQHIIACPLHRLCNLYCLLGNAVDHRIGLQLD